MKILDRDTLADGTRIVAVDVPGPKDPAFSTLRGRRIGSYSNRAIDYSKFYPRQICYSEHIWYWIKDPAEFKPGAGTARQTTMRRFLLERTEDVSGTSGAGIVAEGVEYSNGQVTIHWLSQLECVGVYANLKTLDAVHGHAGKTTIKWLD